MNKYIIYVVLLCMYSINYQTLRSAMVLILCYMYNLHIRKI